MYWNHGHSCSIPSVPIIITFHKQRFSSSSWWEILQSFYQVYVNHGHPCSLSSVFFHPALSSKGSACGPNSIILLLLVYRGHIIVRCCSRRGGRHRRLRNSVISREIKEGFNQLASRSRLRLHCTTQAEVFCLWVQQPVVILQVKLGLALELELM